MSLPNNAAFPFVFVDPKANVQHVHTGLTVREHFAAMAMQGLSSSWNQGDGQHVAKMAVEYADALLAELSKP
jgi:hypothetical protein